MCMHACMHEIFDLETTYSCFLNVILLLNIFKDTECTFMHTHNNYASNIE